MHREYFYFTGKQIITHKFHISFPSLLCDDILKETAKLYFSHNNTKLINTKSNSYEKCFQQAKKNNMKRYFTA